MIFAKKKNMSNKDKMFILVKEYKQTNLTMRAFAFSKGLTYYCFAYWVKVYRRESKSDDSGIRFFDIPEKADSTIKKNSPKITSSPINLKPQMLLELSSGLKITIY